MDDALAAERSHQFRRHGIFFLVEGGMVLMFYTILVFDKTCGFVCQRAGREKSLGQEAQDLVEDSENSRSGETNEILAIARAIFAILWSVACWVVAYTLMCFYLRCCSRSKYKKIYASDATQPPVLSGP
jgi:hypothetical protein